MIEVRNPANQFFDKDGSPLDDGYIYVGTQFFNPETSPIAAFWDKDGTIPAAQPIRTINGYPSRNGAPSKFYTASANYSITVKDKRGSLIIGVTDSNSGVFSELATPAGAASVGYDGSVTGIPGGTVQAAIDALANKFVGYTSWTPTVTSSIGTITTLGAISGRYTRVGSTITFHVNIQITTNGTGGGTVNFTLPTSCASLSIGNGREDAITGNQIHAVIKVGTSASISRYDNAYPGGNGHLLRVSGSYEV